MLRDYAPVPGTLIPGGAAALRVVQWREVSLLFTTGETVNATDSISAYTDHFGQRTGGRGRAFAREDSNLTARRLFRQRSIRGQSPLTVEVKLGGISGSGMVDLKPKKPRPAPS